MQNMILSKNGIRLSINDDPFNGYMKSDDMFYTQSLYENIGWDFSSVWYMNETTGFPDLLWNKSKGQQIISLNSLNTMIYGNEAYTLPAQTDQGLDITWTSSNTGVATISGNTLTIKGAGTATITATQGGNENYAALTKEYALTVNKASLTITADNKTKQVGSENPQLTVSYSGFVYDDDATVLSTSPTVSTTATTSSGVGTYPITVSGAAADNYDITYVNGTLTVTEEPVVIEDTDISQIENVVYIENFNVSAGCQYEVAIRMKNSANIRGFQFSLFLPEGVTAAKTNKGKIRASLNQDRLDEEDEHSLTISEHEDGSLLFLCSSQYDENFLGNDGDVVYLIVNVSEDMEDGDYPVLLKNIKLSETDISVFYETALVKSTMTVSSYMLGDINGDGVVDLSDYIGVANHIHSIPQTIFIEKAGDVDQNNIIDLSDYIGVANIIHYGSIYGNSSTLVKPRNNMELDPQ